MSTRIDALRTEAATIMRTRIGRGHDAPGDITPDAGYVDSFAVRPPVTGGARLLVTLRLVLVTAGDQSQRLTRMSRYVDEIVGDLYGADWLGIAADEAATDEPSAPDTTTFVITCSKHTATRPTT